MSRNTLKLGVLKPGTHPGDKFAAKLPGGGGGLDDSMGDPPIASSR